MKLKTKVQKKYQRILSVLQLSLWIAMVLAPESSPAGGGDTAGGNNIISVDYQNFVATLKNPAALREALWYSIVEMRTNEVADRIPMEWPSGFQSKFIEIDVFFNTYMQKNLLKEDIFQSPIHLEHCKDQNGKETAASTSIGVRNAPICLNTDLIYSNLKTTVNGDEVITKISALLLHEVSHHFQNPKESIKKNEDRADSLGIYFQNFSLQQKTILNEYEYPFRLYSLLNVAVDPTRVKKLIKSPDEVHFSAMIERTVPKKLHFGKEVVDGINQIISARQGTFDRIRKEINKIGGDNCSYRECVEFGTPIIYSRGYEGDGNVITMYISLVEPDTSHARYPVYQVFFKDSLDITPLDPPTKDSEIYLMKVVKKIKIIKVIKLEKLNLANK